MEELFNRKIYQLDVVETNVIEKLDYFYDYRFYEADHSYYYKGEKVGKSVTGLVTGAESRVAKESRHKCFYWYFIS